MERTNRRQAAQIEAIAARAIAYDVPALLGKSIDRVRAKLGHVEDQGPEDDDGAMSWSNKKGALLANYDTSTREVTNFFVGEAYGGSLTEKNRFLLMGHLKENDPRYRLEFVETLGEPGHYMGVRVLPN